MYIGALSKRLNVWIASMGIIIVLSLVYQIMLPTKAEAGLLDTVTQVTEKVTDVVTPSSEAPAASSSSSVPSSSNTPSAPVETQGGLTSITSTVSNVVSEVTNASPANDSSSSPSNASNPAVASPTAKTEKVSMDSSDESSKSSGGLLPGLQIEAPSISIDTPIIKTEVPSVSVNISKDRVSDTSITIPTVKVETPVAGLQTDTLNISNDQSKGVSIRIPEVKVESPIVQVQTPSVQATVPLVPGALPDLQVQSPSIQVETPVMNVEVPSVPIQTSPDIIIVPPPTKVEIPVSSVEIPTFPIDKDEDVNVGNSATDVSVKPPSSEPSSNNNSLTASGDGGKLSVLGEETSLNPTIKDMPSRVEVGGNEPVVIPKPNGAAIEPEQRIAYPETFIDKPLFDQSHEDTGQKIKPDQHYPAPTAKKNAPIEQTLPLPQPRNQLPIPLLYVASSVGQAGASSNAGGSAFGSGNGSFNGKPMSLYSESALPSPVELNLSYARLQLLGSNQWSQPPPGQPPQTLSSHSTVF